MKFSLFNIPIFLLVSPKQGSHQFFLLGSNPLAIKWFVINVGKGETPESIINNGINDLSDFCLSNIY